MNYKQPTSLVKFADAATAKKILTDSRLRWKSPILFDDPFELSHETELSFDSNTLLVSCVKATLGLIFSRDDPKGMSPLVKAVRRWRAEDRFDSEEEAQEILTELLNSMVTQRVPKILEVLQDWKVYASNLRILCLSSDHENPDLWYKFANKHQGVAIRLATGDDTSLAEPMQVSYSEQRPEITTLREQLDFLMAQHAVNPQEEFPEKVTLKSKIYAKEKEWRLIRSISNRPPSHETDNKSLFEDRVFDPSEVRSVYLGARLDEKVKASIIKAVYGRYPKAKLFQAHTMNNQFALDFERLNP